MTQMDWSARILLGECIPLMREIEAESVDAIVTDPPYGIRKGGEAWDGGEISDSAQRQHEGQGNRGRQSVEKRETSLRNMEAGSYDLTLAGMRRFQGWCEEWAAEAFRVAKPGAFLLSSCSPRAYHRMASGIEDAGFEVRDTAIWLFAQGVPKSIPLDQTGRDGWGTALKPGLEPIVVARKPIEGHSTRANVEAIGTGALNIEGCAVADGWPRGVAVSHLAECEGVGPEHTDVLCAPGCPVAALNEMSAGAAHFFFVAKPRPRERVAGTIRNLHPTIKPIELMRWMVRLVTPPGGIVLDPFVGSGTTGCAAMVEGMRFIGIEREPASHETSLARVGDYAFAHGRPRPLGI